VCAFIYMAAENQKLWVWQACIMPSQHIVLTTSHGPSWVYFRLLIKDCLLIRNHLAATADRRGHCAPLVAKQASIAQARCRCMPVWTASKMTCWRGFSSNCRCKKGENGCSVVQLL
jgi:hypothetical protein